MIDVLIVSGAGAYSDPWHPFAETSARLVEILEPIASVRIRSDVAETLSALRAGDAGLVILNFGSAGIEVSTDAGCVTGLQRYLAGGGALLVQHAAASAFPADPRWEELLGGRWVRGISIHPPHGDARIVVSDTEHPVTDGLDDFTLSDERYSHLRVSDDIAVLATHEHDGRDHPMIWAHERDGARVVYDGLGHDGRSFDSPEHGRLVVNAVRWLTAEGA